MSKRSREESADKEWEKYGGTKFSSVEEFIKHDEERRNPDGSTRKVSSDEESDFSFLGPEKASESDFDPLAEWEDKEGNPTKKFKSELEKDESDKSKFVHHLIF